MNSFRIILPFFFPTTAQFKSDKIETPVFFVGGGASKSVMYAVRYHEYILR